MTDMQEVVGGRKIDENGWLNKLLIISLTERLAGIVRMPQATLM